MKSVRIYLCYWQQVYIQNARLLLFVIVVRLRRSQSPFFPLVSFSVVVAVVLMMNDLCGWISKHLKRKSITFNALRHLSSTSCSHV